VLAPPMRSPLTSEASRDDLSDDPQPEAVANFASSREVLEYANSLASVARIEPRMLTRDGQIVILLPGEPGYDD